MDTIEVREVHCHGFKRTGYQAGEFSLKIGDIFNWEKLQIHFSPLRKKILLRSFPENVFIDHLVGTVLREAIEQFCNKKEFFNNLFSFLDQIGESEDFPDPSPFIPEGWDKHPFPISIDYVELRNIQCGCIGKKQLATATIAVGRHFTFFSVPIYDPVGLYIEPKLVNNKAVNDCIDRMIRSEVAKREIELVCTIGHHISTDYLDRESI